MYQKKFVHIHGETNLIFNTLQSNELLLHLLQGYGTKHLYTIALVKLGSLDGWYFWPQNLIFGICKFIQNHFYCIVD